MFLTSLAPNLLAVSFVRETMGLEISWGQWCLGFLPMGVLLFACLPILVYVIYPPEITRSSEVPAWASQELAKIGRLSAKELVMAALVLLALAFWVFGRSHISATAVVLVVISLMIVTNVVSWNDILSNKEAWNVLVWFATLVTLAGGLNDVGFVKWAAENFAGLLGPLSPLAVAAFLVAFFFLIHYIFASITAHTTAILPVLLAVGAGIPGLPTLPFALLLCYSLGLMGVLTPYATGPAPVYYASGYISRAEFWRLGLIFGLIFLAVLLAVGIPYLTAFT
jgi:L-tartrate/succinate antiporter